jgi:hypothetical protein
MYNLPRGCREHSSNWSQSFDHQDIGTARQKTQHSNGLDGRIKGEWLARQDALAIGNRRSGNEITYVDDLAKVENLDRRELWPTG